MNKTLIIGNGEVGKALFNILSSYHKEIYIRDIENLKLEGVRFLHIAYPYFSTFVEKTVEYINHYCPKFVIVHSTVPIGITTKIITAVDSIDSEILIYHSPIRGIHPHLETGIKTFVKFLGGALNEEIIQYFCKCGVMIKTIEKPETTELMKILSTTYYGWNIVFCKEVQKICEEYNLPFEEVYTLNNLTYNEGYSQLDKKEVIRPVLFPIKGKIGGHCVINNCKLLNSEITKTVLKFNENYKENSDG